MGMAASQARLLSITARLSNNELEQQAVAFSKQRLADNADQINDQYLEAMSKTKYQILTGYNSNEATYCDLNYNQLTGLGSVAMGKQYIVRDQKGQVLVPSNIAQAYEKHNGDFNLFLRDLGYTQADINIKNQAASEEAIHQAWDRYLESVGKSIDAMDNGQHILGFDYTSFSKDSFDGYATYNTAYADDFDSVNPTYFYKDSEGYYLTRYALQGYSDGSCGFEYIDNDGNPQIYRYGSEITYNVETEKFEYQNLEGETRAVDVLYGFPDENLVSENYKNYVRPNGTSYVSEGGTAYDIYKKSSALNFEGTTEAQRELYDYALSLTEAYYNCKNSASTDNLKYDKQIINYYKNIFNQIRKSNYTTIENETNLKETNWLVRQLKAGNYTLAYYSINEKAFVGTTLDDDESIVEKEDKAAMAIAEQIYQTRMNQVESQDKQFDLQLNKLSSEHNELQTEYDAVKKVITKNVEKSFNVFNA